MARFASSRRGFPSITQTPRGGWPLYALGALAAGLVAVAVAGAIDWYGKPVAGVLVGPDAVISDVTNQTWDGPRHGLHYPDQVVGVDAVRLDGLPYSIRGSHLARRVWQEVAAGASHVALQVIHDQRERRVVLRIERLTGETWWLLAGSLFFSGGLFLAAGLVALWASPRSPLARSFAMSACASGLFVLTLFDYHTNYRLVSLFLVAFAMLPGSVVVLALRLPDDAYVLRRCPWLERVVTVAGMAVAACFGVSFAAGRQMPFLYRLWPGVLGAGLLLAVLTFLVRYRAASGHRRDILRALALALVPPVVALGLILAVEPLVGGAWAQVGTLAYPALSLIPMAVAFAFVRYDLWGSRVLLSRVLTRLVIGALACLVAIAASVALASAVGASFRSAVVAATVSGTLAAGLVLLALHAAEIYIFPSRAQYKPTIEQLSADLISITSPDEVARAIERTVARWLPCEHIRLVLHAEGPPPVLNVTGNADEVDRPRTGEIPAPAAQGGSSLVLPVVFGTEHLGVLEVGAKPGGALFTSEDLDLLGTMVNQGALALAHARAYQELEQRRKQQAAAWRGEREALVQTVAAEISHEIRYPLNFFRSLFGRGLGRPITAEDLDVGREEVERLERLVGELRRMTAHQLQRQRTAVRELCARAEMLLRDALGSRHFELTGDPELSIRCDPDQVTQILVNLLANALQASAETGHVGVDWQLEGEGVRIEVWDNGPGFVGDPATLFAPWYTTKERGTGLGLAIAHRLVRAHGWSIEATRQAERTVFAVTVPKTDVLASDERRSRERKIEAL
jgi:two-component system sensor histidine kinase HydH